jgi:hypothetical protein
MIDLLINKNLTAVEIKEILAFALNTHIDRINVFSQDEFNNLGDIDFSNIDCLCVINAVKGDVNLRIQLFRYDMPNSKLLKKLQNMCVKYQLICYTPNDDNENWLKFNFHGEVKEVAQLNIDNEDFFLFKNI